MYAKRTAQEAQTAITDEVARRLNVDSNELQTCEKCRDLDAIVDGIQRKMLHLKHRRHTKAYHSCAAFLDNRKNCERVRGV